jgi:outer membrane lipoprotein-sorting protein
MQQKRITIVGPMVLAFVLAGALGASAQDAKAIMDRANAAVAGAKTYQATEKMVMSIGAMGSTALVMDMKMIPGKKSFIKMSADPNVKGTGQMAAASAMMSSQVVDDGTNIYMYMPFMNTYFKMPHSANSAGMAGNLMGFNPADLKNGMGKGTYTLLAPTTIDGRPAYSISFKPSGGPLAKPGAQFQTIRFYIDKSTNRLKRVEMSGTVQGQQMSMTMTTVSDKLNAPIPDSTFVFTPPPGSAEQKGGLGGMMGGMGGAGGMRPGQ